MAKKDITFTIKVLNEFNSVVEKATKSLIAITKEVNLSFIGNEANTETAWREGSD